MSTTDDDLGIKELMQVYGQRLESEHTLISSRMSWLLTLDSFLVAILGVTLANTDKLPAVAFSFWPILVVAAIGAITNSSCLFSNYWGARAIDETSQRVTKELALIAAESGQPTVGPTGTAEPSEEATRWLARLRLYGRDPRSEPERIGFWRPPSGVLHPWFLVPLAFIAAFALTPAVLAAVWGLDAIAFWCGVLCLIIGPALLGSAAAADLAYNRWRSGLTWAEYRELRRRRAAAVQRDVAFSRERAGARHKSELEELRQAAGI